MGFQRTIELLLDSGAGCAGHLGEDIIAFSAISGNNPIRPADRE
jgi:hypothetical protein